MKNDRELLELAAKAAGIHIRGWNYIDYAIIVGGDNQPIGWNPLKDDGDALRLAVKLDLKIHGVGKAVCVHWKSGTANERYGEDRYAATRRAIVRAAAALGEQQ